MSPDVAKFVRDEMLAVLRSAMRDRPSRDEYVDGELGWVRHERQVMLDAVNTRRAASGKPGIAMDGIVQAEMSACGHVDYAEKFALNCAELAVES